MGIVESAKTLEFGPRRGALVYGYIRATPDRSRWFLHPSDCLFGVFPRRFDAVEFDADPTSDPKGPRARNVRILDAPGGNDSDRVFEDCTVLCSGCREAFVWTAGEQQFYYERRLHPPKKCKSCARAWREQLEAQRAMR